MRVLLVNNFHFRKGGSDVVYLNTSQLLRDNGHDVISFSQAHQLNQPDEYSNYFPRNPEFLTTSTFKRVVGLGNYFYSTDAARNLRRLIYEQQPDIAHLHIFYGGLSSSILSVLKQHRIPVVATLHEYKLLCPVATFVDGQGAICEKCANGSYFHCATKKCFKDNRVYSVVQSLESYFRDWFFNPADYFDRVICVSKFSLDKHIQYRPRLKPILRHIYNFSPELEERAVTPKRGKYILYFGRISSEKGIATLIEASRLLSDRPKVRIVGTGPLDLQINSLAEDDSSVEVLGYKSGEELYRLIQEAEFTVVPSEWFENNPMTIIESYFLGTPVIGARIGGIPEMVVEGKTGFLFKSGDAEELSDVINRCSKITQEDYEQMANGARQFAMEKFASKKHYRELLSLYELVLDGK